MTVVLPQGYHAKDALESHRIECKTFEEALKQDIRALRIGILNIMPQAESYEFNLLYSLGRSVLQIEPVWIKLETHGYSSSDQSHLAMFYKPFGEILKRMRLDGLILTGAPVEHLEYEQIHYWDEVQRILRYARLNIASTLGICWGGMALAKMLGVGREGYPVKLFGVFEARNCVRKHPITGDMDDVFFCPQSRHAGVDPRGLAEAVARGDVRILADGRDTGPVIFESSDGRYLAHLGHPEYNSRRIVEEYLRDKAAGRSDVKPPANFDIDNPLNRWRSHRHEFFTQWIKYIYDRTQF